MIKLRTLNLEALNYHDDSHYSLVRRLDSDKAVQEYITSRFSAWIKEPSNGKDYEVGKSYVIRDKDKLIGMCGSTNFTKTGILDLWLAIVNSERKSGYGEKSLIELTLYLIEKMQKLDDVKLMINKYNYASKKTAEKCGYKLMDSKGYVNEYRYFGG